MEKIENVLNLNILNLSLCRENYHNTAFLVILTFSGTQEASLFLLYVSQKALHIKNENRYTH